MASIYEEGFEEFINEGMSAEKRDHYRAAASNYYKALTEACSYLISAKTGKIPNNHSEIFLFLKVNFPDVYDYIDPAFSIYTKSYDSKILEEDVAIIKDAIRKISARSEISEKIRAVAERI